MNSENAIEVKNVKKRFKVYLDKGNSMKEKILFRSRNRYEDRWVLKGVSFNVKKGEAVGLIGKNGCGKSTTLKMLTRIMYPTEGKIELTGRVSSLIELGAGFHPDMSGRENIFTNASIFGLNHAEIEGRLDDIIKFSELEEFIDNPVRTYSSGMYMRLAFAVAINVDADILLIDEILAVGDVSFQAKCFEKLKEIKRKGTTIVIVSHVTQQIKNICDRAIWIDEGLIREEGMPGVVTEHYLGTMEERRMEKIEKDFQDELNKREEKRREEREAKKEEEKKKKKLAEMQLPDFCRKGATRRGNLKICFTDAKIFNSEGKETSFFKTGEQMEVFLKYDVTELPEERINFAINVTRDDGVYIYGTTALSGTKRTALPVKIGENEIRLVVERNNLLEGLYLVDIGIQDIKEKIYDRIGGALEFRVKNSKVAQNGTTYMPVHWVAGDMEIHVTPEKGDFV
ncbi:ABC transporter ATP-binding protein [Lachnospiraceae bacterium 38-14]